MASEISMNGRKKIETLQKEFSDKFHYLTLVILDKERRAIDVTKSLAQVRQAKGADISIIASLKVNTLEKRFLMNFGLIVEVAYKKADKIIYTKETVDKTLNELNKWCEENDCQPFEFKKKNTGNTLRSVQEQLLDAVSEIYPNAIAKKINKDNFLDIHIPEINPKRGTHLFFNTAKDGIKIGFYCRDEEFVNNILDNSDNIEKYAQGIRILNNPNFENVLTAIKGALTFLKNITGSEFDIDKVLNGLDSGDTLDEQDSGIVENLDNTVDLDTFLDQLNNAEESENLVEVLLYTQQYSSLTYWLKFELAGSLIEVTRVNWSNDSYWKSSITISDLYDGLLNYKENNDTSEFIDNYVTSDLIDYVFAGVGHKDNGFEYQVDSIEPELETIPEEYQDYSGDLDITMVMNELLPTSEDLSEQSIGTAAYYEFKFGDYSYTLNIVC